VSRTKKQTAFQEDIALKKNLVLIVVAFLSVFAWSLFSEAATKKYTDADSVISDIQGMGIAQNAKYVKSAGTSDPLWKAYLFKIEQGNTKLPMVVYANSTSSELAIGVLLKNGKLVTPKLPVEELQPQTEADVSKLSMEHKKIYNPAGKKTVFMFFDPDCPYCRQVEAKLRTYKGAYRVVMKYLPLEQIHPDAARKAISDQCDQLGGTCTAEKKEIAQNMVETDIKEAMEVGVRGTPSFIDSEGHMLSKIPDLQ
jgi:protein-disulfide isomerase